MQTQERLRREQSWAAALVSCMASNAVRLFTNIAAMLSIFRAPFPT